MQPFTGSDCSGSHHIINADTADGDKVVSCSTAASAVRQQVVSSCADEKRARSSHCSRARICFAHKLTIARSDLTNLMETGIIHFMLLVNN